MTQTRTVAEQVREIIGRLSPLDPGMPSPDDSLIEDLGFDSLGLFELVMELERELDLPPLSAEEAMDIVTVGQVEELVVAALGAAEA